MKYLGEFLINQPCIWLDAARRSRKESVQQLETIAEDISDQYRLYDNLIASCNDGLPNSTFLQHSNLLIDYYEKAPKELNKLLLERRNEHELSFCPYCGNPMIPDTLDHFIPKGKWPEFSIFPNNLVPQCRGCAPVKGENYYCTENNLAMFIHPIYFNFLDNFRFSINVLLNAESKDISITVKLKKVMETPSDDQSRVILHAEKLKIKSRIINYCKKDFRQWTKRLSNAKFDVKVALQQRLSEVPELDIGKDWQSAFYDALLKNEEIINYMNSLHPQVEEHLHQQPNCAVDLDFN
ncbi:HNH endonuclease [Proteus mirabilis]|uniref:HNH endonuclease n=1 Tax=Proteus TaxID=583 RepID=UPI000D725714|nr:HNH endonuclease [Proteus mirabilis]MDM3741712.1 HNH endonuclease [Proteus mirabilis]PXA26179.1 HNH endonuclease [Proteus mirabilis]HBC7480366.1 HNH endonuclease [Proteus mirabilis]HCT5874301.1 HNH endonuclease [Proteus mirabilis]HEK3162590.1 HNH endonuclease [Proteus mirabilis]